MLSATKTKQKKLHHVGHDQPPARVVQVPLLEGGDGTDPGKLAYLSAEYHNVLLKENTGFFLNLLPF